MRCRVGEFSASIIEELLRMHGLHGDAFDPQEVADGFTAASASLATWKMKSLLNIPSRFCTCRKCIPEFGRSDSLISIVSFFTTLT